MQMAGGWITHFSWGLVNKGQDQETTTRVGVVEREREAIPMQSQ